MADALVSAACLFYGCIHSLIVAAGCRLCEAGVHCLYKMQALPTMIDRFLPIAEHRGNSCPSIKKGVPLLEYVGLLSHSICSALQLLSWGINNVTVYSRTRHVAEMGAFVTTSCSPKSSMDGLTVSFI